MSGFYDVLQLSGVSVMVPPVPDLDHLCMDAVHHAPARLDADQVASELRAAHQTPQWKLHHACEDCP